MRKVLIVDDSSILRSLLKVHLGKYAECDLMYAANGQEALETIAAKGEPDLMFVDVNMPIMDGLELLSRLRKLGVVARVPIVIVSTEGKEADVLRGLEAGARAYLRKPFTAKELHAIVEKLVVA